jgi:two-component system, chemotaxis family, chemotaxis protein CheY
MDLKILVIDAVPAQLRALENILKQAGVEKVIQARNLKDALLVMEKETDINLIISEWDLSDKTGIDLLAELKGKGRLDIIPVLLSFKDKSKEEILKALKAGAKGFIVKPYSLETIKVKVAAFALAEGPKGESNESLINNLLHHGLLE